MTVEFEPITTQDAHRILDRERNTRTTPGSGREVIRRRTTSQVNITPVARKASTRPEVRPPTSREREVHGPRTPSSHSQPAKQPATWLIASVVIALLLIVVAAFGILNSSAPSNLASHSHPSGEPAPASPVPTAVPTPKPPAAEPKRAQPEPAELVPAPAEPPASPEPTEPKPPVAEGKTEADPASPPATPVAPEAAPATPVQPAPEPASPTPAPVVATKEPAPAPAPAPAASAVSGVLREILPLLAKRAFDAAEARVRDAAGLEDGAREALAAALRAMQADEKALRANLDAQVGKTVKLSTARETVSGKLASADLPLLKVERPIVINGEVRGTRVTEIRVDELTAEVRAAFLPEPATPDAWAGRALGALSETRADDASAALKQLGGHALKDALELELARAGDAAREEQARAAWAKLAESAEGAATLTRVRQAIADLEAFEKDFGTTAHATQPSIASERAELRAQLERAALCFDPRVQKLFKGRVVSYEARTGTLTLAYDFSTKEQLDDFENIVWAPPGDHSGVTWKKGSITVFGKSVTDTYFIVPMFAANSARLQAKIATVRQSGGRRVCFYLPLYRDGAASGARPVVYFDKTETRLLDGGKEVATTSAALLPNADGTLEVATTENNVTVKVNGKEIFNQSMPTSRQSGFLVQGGWDTGCSFSFLQITGKLSSEWLAKALNAAKP
ncbi:MAG: hypothetical protein KIS92_15230 [Planctomycetota bacterium]|nr:hypothetical protein [Planctomycetota bacterium]